MKLYRARVPAIAHAVIERLVNEGDIDIAPEDREESQRDLVAIMDSYLKRDADMREAIRDHMDRKGMSYDQFSKARSEVATEWGHPLGSDVDAWLARQFIENFMISRFVGEVFSDDRVLYNKVRDVLKAHDVDERALRAEAEERIKNIPEGSVERQDALQRALKEVRKRHGLA